jgi:ferritin-like metal-binding protein YciE
MSKKQELSVVEQKTVLFLDDELVAIRATDNQIYVSLNHLCQALGLNRQGQMQRIQRHIVLSEGYTKAKIQTPNDTHPQTYGVIRVDLVPMWLSGIEVRRVKEDVKNKLIHYQKEAAKVLWEAFQEGRLTTEPLFDEMLESDSEAVQAYKMLQAMVKLARNQILLESQVDTHTSQLADHEKRLEQVETSLGAPDHTITADQASQISQAVKAVAFAMGGHSKHYQAIYNEMYRKFGITSYKLLPAAQFEDAMEWLTEWHNTLVGDTPF